MDFLLTTNMAHLLEIQLQNEKNKMAAQLVKLLVSDILLNFML